MRTNVIHVLIRVRKHRVYNLEPVWILCHGAVVLWLSLLHSFIQLSLNSGSAQVRNPARGVSEIRDGEDL